MSVRVFRFVLLSVMGMTLWAACSGKKVAPLPPVPPTPPGYVMVPHPEGMDIGDLMAIFTDRQAPSPEELEKCDADFLKLRKLTNSRAELQQGAREFVRAEPVKFHWCFYSKLLRLEEKLSEENFYIQERQRAVLDAYVFITPFARAFSMEFQDSRYLRWAVSRYRRLSETVFYRKLDLTPELTADLANAANPFGLQRPRDDSRGGVLHKYGLLVPEDPIPIAPSGPATPPTALLPMAGAENGLAPPPPPVPPEANATPLPTPVATATVQETAPPPPPIEEERKPAAAPTEATPATAPPTAPAEAAPPPAATAPAPVSSTPTAAEISAAESAPLVDTPTEAPPIEAVLDGNNVTAVE